jgi:hypothetical protein
LGENIFPARRFESFRWPSFRSCRIARDAWAPARSLLQDVMLCSHLAAENAYQVGVPNGMHVRGATLKQDANVVATPIPIVGSMRRLMNIADEVNQKTQRLCSDWRNGRTIGKDALVLLDLSYDAIFTLTIAALLPTGCLRNASPWSRAAAGRCHRPKWTR